MLNKIGARLTATFGAVLVLLLAICVTVSLLMARMNANTQTIVKDRAVKVALANQFKEGAYLGNLWAYRAMDETTLDAQQADVDQIQAQRKKNAALYKALQDRINTDAERAAYDHLVQVRTPYAAALEPIYAQLALHNTNGAHAAMLSIVPLQTALFKAQNEF